MANGAKPENNSSSTQKKRGRGPSYTPDFIDQAYKYCLLGATDAELATYLGIAESTLYDWKKKYPEFSESIKRGKKPADAVIAHAVFERAKGAKFIEQQAFKLKTITYNENGKKVSEEERIEIVDLEKQAPPDTTACIFFLKNRDKEHWSDVQKLEHSASDEFLEALKEAHRG